MKVVVCNIGSSSFKFQLLEMDSEACLARGVVERVGSSRARTRYWVGDEEVLSSEGQVSGQKAAVTSAIRFLERQSGLLKDLTEVAGVGFKCVQAGEKSGTVLLEPEILQAMEDYRDLAPAHNPPYLEAIYMFRRQLPETALVGVFEPGFHASVPEAARVYGTPFDWYRDHGVRRYGYHGASHRFVSGEVVRLLEMGPRHRIISCHLGGSSSMCAVKDGSSIDTSMGFTPQSGLIQGSRIGDMDPFVLPHIMRRKGITLEEALEECSRNGGLAGLSGTSGDMRDIKKKIAEGDDRARLAREKFIYDIRRYLGEYHLLLQGLDAIAFTGGIGQRDSALRAEVLSSLSFLGLKLDPVRNEHHDWLVTHPDSSIAALVIEANEELVVARETVRVISGENG